MANRIYLQVQGSKKILNFPLMEDVTFETTSKFTSFTEFSSILDTGSQMINTVGALTGSIGKGLGNIRNVLDAPRWTGTDPIKLTTDLMFYTRTNPKEDVFDKMKYIISLNILTDKNGKYYTPGVSARTAASLLMGGGGSQSKSLKLDSKTSQIFSESEETYDYNSKLLALEIPGVIYLKHAFVVNCIPTVSKQKTESGYPLWAKLNVQFSGIYPANTQIFKDVETAVKLENRI